jgi:hypothetical protein
MKVLKGTGITYKKGTEIPEDIQRSIKETNVQKGRQ